MTSLLPLGRGNERTVALLHRLWREHLIHHKGRMVLIAVLTLIMSATTAIYPLVINHAFNMFTRHDARILYQLPVLVVIVTGVKAAAQYFQNVQVQQAVLLVIRELQSRMFAHLTRADLARLEREAPAQLASHFTTDAATIREALTKTVNGVADVVTVIGLIASMIYMNWLLSLIAAAMYPIAILPIERIGRRIRRASGGMQERVGETATLLNESFAQARTVRAYRLEMQEVKRADAAFGALYKSLLRISKNRSRVEPVLEVLGGAAVAGIIGFEGWRASVNDHTLGDFTGFVAALLIASRPLRALGSLNAALQEGLAGMVRVFAIIDEEPTIVDAPDAARLPRGEGHVVFDRVRFVYPDGRVGLENLSFEARPGTTVALVGPSGGGKSTALALIPRLHDATAGSVRIDGMDVRQVTLSSLRDAIAYVGQDALLFDDTVAANIAMGHPGASQAAIEAAAEAAAAAGFINDLPLGYETRVGTNGQRLSGGQRQRVALARALLRNPRILLLDEATSALDTESEAAVQEALTRLRRGRTTIVIAHRLSTVRDADLVVALSDGKAEEAGTHADLMAHEGLYARLVRSQSLIAA
ncbi:MAG: ABC transporter ATP-binding protein [Proteobacteria bacterium]|nr:ABC transporter ATP-binding protein [Pseudomonadota bacterium]